MSYIQSGDIIHNFTEEQIRKCNLFEMTGSDKRGNKGWMLRKSTKKMLSERGFVPFTKDGKTGKGSKCWNPAVMDEMKTMVEEAIERVKETSESAQPISRDEILFAKLDKITGLIEMLISAWK